MVARSISICLVDIQMSVENREGIVANDCVLSADEIQYLRSLECSTQITDEVEALQEDIYCANKARTEKIYAWLWLANARTNGQIIQMYADKLADQSAVLDLFARIDTDQSLQDDDKPFLKVIIIVRALLAEYMKNQPKDVGSMSCSISIDELKTSSYLKNDICSLTFWKSLREFQQITG